MDYSFRKQTYLEETRGEVEFYNDIFIQEFFTPLKISNKGIESRMSGGRSALLNLHGKNYKLKGCNPQEGMFSMKDLFHETPDALDIIDPTNKPKGAMSYDSAEKEIELQLAVANKLEEFDLPAPLYPIARFDYEMEGRHCVVSLCNGDLRLQEFRRRVGMLHINLSDFKNQFNQLNQWMGFAQYITKSAIGNFGGVSNNELNYVLYKINNQYGLGRVDFPKRSGQNNILIPEDGGEFEQYVVDFLSENYSTLEIKKKIDNYNFEYGFDFDIPLSKLPDKHERIDYLKKGLEGDQPELLSRTFVEAIL